MPAVPPPAEPRLVANPPSALHGRGALAGRLRARWAVLRGHGRVSAARGAALGPGVRFDVAPGARVLLGPGCVIGGRSRLHVAGGEVRIGSDAVLGERCVLHVMDGASIGRGCRLADEVVLADHGPRYEDVERPIRRQGVQAQPIVVGDGVRVGSRAVLLGGAHVADGTQVGAQAVVRGPVLAHSPDEPPARR